MPKVVWTESQETHLRVLWREGMTALNISKKIGRTRNAVIGKANRLGLDPRAAAAPRSKKRRVEKLVAKPKKLVRTKKVTIAEIGDKQCRWPYGDEPPFMFCAAPTDGRSYCEYHHAKAMTPPAPRPRKSKLPPRR